MKSTTIEPTAAMSFFLVTVASGRRAIERGVPSGPLFFLRLWHPQPGVGEEDDVIERGRVLALDGDQLGSAQIGALIAPGGDAVKSQPLDIFGIGQPLFEFGDRAMKGER